MYCGREALLTEDHIPPKALYPSVLWSQLLKIPSCLECNGGASKDDEYLRTIIGLSAKGERDEILKPVSDAAVRSLVRPEATGFRASILNGITEMFVSGPEGIFRVLLLASLPLAVPFAAKCANCECLTLRHSPFVAITILCTARH